MFFFSTRRWAYLLGLLLLGASKLATAQRFAAIGDYGYAGPAERDVADLVKSWNPDFIITLGDNNYDLGDSLTIDQNVGQYYHEYIGNYRGRYGPRSSTNRFFPTLGNHDYYTRNGEAYRYYFTLPGNGRYYEFVRGSVHFFALNSDPQEPDGITETSRQAAWLKEALAKAKEPWKVVYFHHAPYSSGWHGNTPGMQWPFKEWGASVVLAGHDHHYERLLADGLPYFVNGLGGRSIYNIRPQRVPESEMVFRADFGAMRIDANQDSLRLQFITRNRVLADSYTLRRDGGGSAKLFPVIPNPSRDGATVEFFLPEAADVDLRVLNNLGQEVARLYQGPARAGWQRIDWPRNGLKAGIYYVQLIGRGFTQMTRAEIL